MNSAFTRIFSWLYIHCFLLIIYLLVNNSTVVAQSGDPVFDFAKQQFDDKLYMPAISSLKGYIARKPNDANALYLLAKCYSEIGDFTQANVTYEKVLKFKPKIFELYEDLGNNNKKQNKFAIAAEYYTKALLIRDTSIRVLNNRGMCFYYLENFEAAIKDFNKVLKLDSTYYLAYNNRGSSRYNNQNIADASIIDLRMAEADFNKCLKLRPDFELAYRNRGIVRFYMDSLSAAYKDLWTAIQLDPNDANAHYYMGKTLFKQNNFPVAIQFYDNAVKLVNYKADMFLDRGICKLEMGDYEGSKEDFVMASLINKQDPKISYHMARLYAAEDDKSGITFALRRAKELGLFINTKYFTYINKDKYFANYLKDKDFMALIEELKWGK